MRKVVVVFITILLSMSCYASITTDLKFAITNTIQSHFLNAGNHEAIVYGGQDLSRPQIAIANEKFLTNASRLIV